jgi:hypothetical protein
MGGAHLKVQKSPTLEERILSPPVLLVVFNRPRETRRVVEALRKAQVPRLYVAADGPRPGQAQDQQRCAEVRAIFDDLDWPCELHRDFANENLDCAERMVSALDWAFGQEEKLIVLEDDCVPDASFFPYCEALLDRYRDDERVGHINGTNFLGNWSPTEDSYFPSVWAGPSGWASWARAWRHFEREASSAWDFVRHHDLLEKALPPLGLRRFFENEMSQSGPSALSASLSIWDFHWWVTLFAQHMVSLVPSRNLVENIGFNAEARHTQNGDDYRARLESSALDFPLRHPKHLLPTYEYERQKRIRERPPLFESRARVGGQVADVLSKIANRLR